MSSELIINGVAITGYEFFPRNAAEFRPVDQHVIRLANGYGISAIGLSPDVVHTGPRVYGNGVDSWETADIRFTSDSLDDWDFITSPSEVRGWQSVDDIVATLQRLAAKPGPDGNSAFRCEEHGGTLAGCEEIHERRYRVIMS